MKKLLFGYLLFFVSWAFSQNHEHMHMQHAPAPEMPNMQEAPMDHHKMHMHGMYGNYSMSRECSGTSWVPDSSPIEDLHYMVKDWTLMLQGYSYLIYDKQRGTRGSSNVFDENMFMFMAQKDIEKNTVAFRSMFALEPLTIGKGGYSLLFQTGETANGKTPLIDKQHPHDLFMELAVTYARRINEKSSAFIYFGLPGEPAVGPPVFMHRFSSEYNPEAPLTHHWLDSTHITFGVLTGGFVYKKIKLEASAFKGREPDQHRFDIEAPKFNSGSVRLSYNPTENIALQASYGFLKSPEQLEPNVNVNRYTLSAIYNKNVEDKSNWQTIFSLGINQNKPGHTLPGFLLDSTFELKKRHLIFGRFESVLKDELFVKPDPLAGKKFLINKFTFGYIYEFLTGDVKWGLGALIDTYVLPSKIREHYDPSFSYMIFLQTRLGNF